MTPRAPHIDMSGVVSQKGKEAPRKHTLMISRQALMRDLESWYARRQDALSPGLPPEKHERNCFNKELLQQGEHLVSVCAE